jgi:hypothetical protein
MKTFICCINNEEGNVLVVALFVLILLTIIGIAATDNTSVELKISANDKFHKIAFYAAEAARSYVAGTTGLYGPDNILVGLDHYFPNDTDPYVANTSDPSPEFTLAPDQSFKGTVTYRSASPPPRGSGYAVGQFRAHNYDIASTGAGPRNAESQIQAGFYRIGF